MSSIRRFIRTGLIVSAIVPAVVPTAGCGSTAPTRTAPPAVQRQTTAPPAVQRQVATEYASAELRGNAAAAETFVRAPDEAALAALVEDAAEGWGRHNVSIREPTRRGAHRWAFEYARRRNHDDGRFEIETGELVVVVAPWGSTAGVRFFALTHLQRRFSTHDDARLLPSQR